MKHVDMAEICDLNGSSFLNSFSRSISANAQLSQLNLPGCAEAGPEYIAAIDLLFQK